LEEALRRAAREAVALAARRVRIEEDMMRSEEERRGDKERMMG
jgi:hypothetical protein